MIIVTRINLSLCLNMIFKKNVVLISDLYYVIFPSNECISSAIRGADAPPYFEFDALTYFFSILRAYHMTVMLIHKSERVYIF